VSEPNREEHTVEKLPGNLVIPQEKLLQYLLLPRAENDKSRFLATAGYNLANWKTLQHHLIQIAQNDKISESEGSPYGAKYSVCGVLTGPNGKTLHVTTIWITLEGTKETRFVTLFPDREVHRENAKS
jgi:hypothetical protein